MAKTVFRPIETVNLKDAYLIGIPEKIETPLESDEEPIVEAVEYTGPSIEDIRHEVELYKENWEREKELMLSAAKTEASEIISRAENAAFDEVKRKTDQAMKIKQEAEEAAEKALQDAEQKIKIFESQTKARIDDMSKEARAEGFKAGRDEGFNQGKLEVERLTDRLHVLLNKTMEKRAEILDQTEAQIIELVLLISRKVVKTISENQKSVVLANITQALRKVKTRGSVVIRVNLSDLKLATEHTQNFIEMVESAPNLSIVEDSAVDKGGCIIETDFGEIDARIQSQMHELEEAILDISPIKTRGKAQ